LWSGRGCRRVNEAARADIEQLVGDDWSVTGNLTDLDGSPLDLTGAVIEWTLTDPSGAVVAEITIWPNAAGSLTISLARDVTELFEPGRYTDKLRVAVNGRNDVMWTGCFPVAANLFVVRPPDWPAPLPWPIPRVRPYSVAIDLAVAHPQSACRRLSSTRSGVTDAPHPNHPGHRSRRQIGQDEVLFMAATEPPRYWNRIRTQTPLSTRRSARARAPPRLRTPAPRPGVVDVRGAKLAHASAARGQEPTSASACGFDSLPAPSISCSGGDSECA
jgi:hypothetical protein